MKAVNVFKPYLKTADGFQYDEVFATKRTPQLFFQIPLA